MIREYIYFADDNPNGTSGMTEDEIIRCNDCKHFYADAECGQACELTEMRVSVEDFCSYGERKDNETR